MNSNYEPLTVAVFHILLALSLGKLHGYAIMKQVEKDSQGKLLMGPGTLYGSIKRMLRSGLIEEVNNPKDERRKFYRLTGIGRKNLSAEIQRYEEIVNLATNNNVLGTINLSI